MVYQGTVLGLPLWNCFFGDVRRVVQETGFLETLFADDLHCYTEFEPSAAHSSA